MRLLTYIFLAVFASAASADIYRSVDEYGNVVYSDTPSEGAEKIEVQDAQTVDSPETEPFRYEPPEEDPPPRYKSLAITSPKNEQPVRANDGNMTVQMSVSPSLRGRDRLVLVMDGKQVASGNSTSVSLQGVNRGTHTLEARIVAGDGETVLAAKPVTFHLLRHSVQQPKPPPGPLNPPGGAN